MTLTQVTTGGVDENINIDSNTLKVDGTNNRVGIGTSAPKRALHLDGGSGGVQIQLTNDTTGKASDGDGFQLQVAGDGTARVTQRENLNLAFDTNNTERMRIDSSGRLYVGTTTAGFANGDDLNIATSGHTGITIRSGTTSTGNIFFADGTSSIEQYKGIIRYDHNADAMPFFTAANERLRIDSSGNVGIGTSSPGDQLHIHTASSGAANVRFSSTDVSNGFFVGFDGDERAQIWHTANKPIRFATNNTEQMRLGNDGKLLIGSDTGSVHGNRLLQVGKTDRSETYVAITSSSSGIAGIVFADTTTNDTGGYRGLIEYQHNNDAMVFRTSAVERIRVNSSGQLLVGATSAGSADKVLVSGQLNAGGVRFASLAKSDTVGSTMTFDISGANEGYVFVRIRIKVGYSGNAGYQMHAQYDYASCNYYTSGATATQTGILQVESGNAQFNYSDITVTRPANRTIRVQYAPSSGSGTHSCKVMVDGIFDSIS